MMHMHEAHDTFMRRINQNHIYKQCIHSIFGRGITEYTVIYVFSQPYIRDTHMMHMHDAHDTHA